MYSMRVRSKGIRGTWGLKLSQTKDYKKIKPGLLDPLQKAVFMGIGPIMLGVHKHFNALILYWGAKRWPTASPNIPPENRKESYEPYSYTRFTETMCQNQARAH